MFSRSDPQTTLIAPPPTDTFGCPFDKLYKNQTLRGADIEIFRKGTRDACLEQISTPASDRGFVVGVSMLVGHTRRVFYEHHSATYVFSESSIYVRRLSEAYKADLGKPFDFVLLEISPASLDRIALESDFPTVSSLQVQNAAADPVLWHMAQAITPALERPEESSKLFVDQLATAMGTHIIQRYGGKSFSVSRAKKLSRAHESLAKDLLLDNLNGDISVLEIAKACNLSRSHFTRAFRETTGMTPYQWLLNERVRRARELLRNSDMAISEIAASCGFADQSHFTRVFSSNIGVSPGRWRRKA